MSHRYGAKGLTPSTHAILIVFRVLGMDFDKEFPNIGHWMRAMVQRPSVHNDQLKYEDYPRVIKFNNEFRRGEFPKYLASGWTPTLLLLFEGKTEAHANIYSMTGHGTKGTF